MNSQNKTITIFLNTSIQEIKTLLRVGYHWVLIIKENGEILGVLDEMRFWRETSDDYQEDSFSVIHYINNFFKVYSKWKDIDENEVQNYDYIILESATGYKCYSINEIHPIKLQQRIDSLISIHEEVKQKLEDYKRSNVELRQILNYTYDEVFVTDASGNILFVSEASRRLTGLPPESFLGRNVKELNEKGIIADSGTLQTMKTKKTQTVEQRYPTGITVLATSQPIFDQNGNIHRIVTNSRDITELVEVKKKINQLTKESHQKPTKESSVFYYKGLITVDDHFLSIIDTVKRVSELNSSVFIDGETGVGKGVIARMIHELSPRNKQKFVQINCGAIKASLIESELFGYESGSFTGASKQGKKGLVELASGGTLFLDEIGEMPLDLQVKLLHLLQEKKFMRLGGTKEIQADIRIISATNKSLRQLIKEKKFREDLYYRLHVIPLHLPPLRERKEDIVILIDYFTYKYNKIHNKSVELEDDSKLMLKLHNFPGNVRELENLIEQIVATASNDTVSKEDLSVYFYNGTNDNNIFNQSLTLKQAVDKAEEQAMIQALKVCKTTRCLAANLGVSQTTIMRKLKKFNLNTTDFGI